MNVNACLDSANARDLAAHLLAAADEVDELNRSEIRTWNLTFITVAGWSML
jgi:hypothetical protein